MKKTIAFISQKGGVGKSTITVLVANILYFYFDLKVAIIDADFPQHSISKGRDKELALIEYNKKLKTLYKNITEDKPPYPIYRTELSSCAEEIQKIREQYDIVLIDPPGALNQDGIVDTINEVNDFFIPILQDNYSLMSSIELYSILINKVKPTSTNFSSCHLFFNRVPAKSKVATIKKELSGKVPFMEEEISAYTIYERAYRSTILPIPKGKKESDKLFLFVNAFIKRLNLDVSIN